MSSRVFEIFEETVYRAVRSPVMVGSVTSVAGVTAGYALAPEKEVIKETVYGKPNEVIKEMIIEVPISEPSQELLAREQESLRVRRELDAIEAEWKALIQNMIDSRNVSSKSEFEKKCREQVIWNEEMSQVPVEIMGTDMYKRNNEVDIEWCIEHKQKEQRKEKSFEYNQAVLKYQIRTGKKSWEPKLPSLEK